MKILDNRRITIGEVVNDVGISFGSCQAIFTDVLGMKRTQIAAKLLNFQQKQRRLGDVHDIYRQSTLT